jgi:short-subunit dehydrogenase
MNILKGKSALITGASKGIGRALALALAREGYDLALCSRNIEELQKLKNEIQNENATVKVFLKSCDFSSSKEVEQLAEWVEKKFPVLDVLVNNVGIYERVTLLNEGPNVLNNHMQINLYTPHFLSKYFGQIMRDARKGHIFNITSIASRDPVAAAGSYTITKYALTGLTKVLREELRKSGVKVTEIIPGSTLTSSWEGTEVPVEQFVWPEDIAKVLLTCLSLSPGANIEEVIIKPLVSF